MARTGDPEYDGFRIEALWAWTVVDPADNQEGIPGVPAPGGGVMPLVASDRVRLEELRPIAQQFADMLKSPVRLRRFVPGDVDPLETLNPRG
jgi:hypothetical protein